jgi:hypothetical protein
MRIPGKTAGLLVLLLAASLPGCRTEPPPEAAIELRDLAIDAALGDRIAQYDLAVEFYRGNRLPRDYAKAGKLWRQAAAQGDVDATNNLGFLAYNGLDGPASPAEGVRLWQEAAAKGHPESQYHLGYAAEQGKGMPLDRVEAYARYEAAVLIGDRSRDPVDGDIVRDAVESRDALRPRLSAQERADAERRAAEYARVPVRKRGDEAPDSRVATGGR